nr:unnamed protein product [Callosobruchus analis]
MINDDEVTDNVPETQRQENENEDDETILEVEPEIKSYNDALDVISKLKIFAKYDYAVFHQLKNLKNHHQNCVLKQKTQRLKQSRISDFLNSNRFSCTLGICFYLILYMVHTHYDTLTPLLCRFVIKIFKRFT